MISASTVAQELAQQIRTLVLGGTAVILHGLNRATKDLDLWLDPNPDEKKWAASIEQILQMYPEIYAVYLDDNTGKWEAAERNQISQCGIKGRVLRLMGSDRPIDIFYIPNELEKEEFDKIWERAIPLRDGSRLLDEIDLIITKQLTGRPHDIADINFLQAKIEDRLCGELPVQSYEYAAAQFQRFRSAKTAYSATKNKAANVQKLGLDILQELAQSGDPFAAEYLEQMRKENSVPPSASN